MEGLDGGGCGGPIKLGLSGAPAGPFIIDANRTVGQSAVYDPAHPEAMQDGWRYVLPGDGQLPLTEAIAVLKQNGYDGWILFENEKRWHPTLAEPEVAFPAFVSWIRPLITD